MTCGRKTTQLRGPIAECAEISQDSCLKPWLCHQFTACLWVSHLTLLCLSFPMGKMEVIIIMILPVFCK